MTPDVSTPDVNNAVAADTSSVQIPVVDRPTGTVGMPYAYGGAVPMQGPYQVVPVPVALPATPQSASDMQLLLGLAAAFYFLLKG